MHEEIYEQFEEGTYLHNFFREKEFPIKVWEITDSRGLDHIITGDAVIEAIASTQGQERQKIEDILRKIDFSNGDVNHFLEHLAKGLAEQYNGILRT